jgi:hypothetical protein
VAREAYGGDARRQANKWEMECEAFALRVRELSVGHGHGIT